MAVLSPNEMMAQFYEPKYRNRFALYVEGIPMWMIKSAKLPSYDDGEIQLDHINTYRMVRSGKRKWADVELVLYDPVDPNGQGLVMEWARLAHESVTGRSGYSDFYKKDISLNILGGPGDIIAEWIIKGAYIKSFDPGTYDWSDAESVGEINVTLTYDYAILQY